ncbi:alanine/glycine:cation symporter family protein [Aquipuribacter sp. MA13-6]|uniref:alanine/glycine:cation symporter family protein n=1 Tax=unclassified Aquipuribacter TaxID=2635084 RepID=UPI003EEA7255
MSSVVPTGVISDVEGAIDGAFTPLSDAVGGVIFYPVTIAGSSFPWIVAWLIIGAVVFTIGYRFIQFRGFGHAVALARGGYDDPDDPGEVTHFQALTAAVSGTVGLGNIAGVAVAVSIGGPGATFWMIVAGLLGMATKFVECTLGVAFREEHEDGTVTGGPFRYLKVAFAKLRIPVLPSILVGVYAIAILAFGLAGGNMFQANQMFAQVQNVTGGDDGVLGGPGASLIFGVVVAVVVGLVILGGIQSIAKVTSRLVPAMAIVYVLGCLTVIGFNAADIPGAMGEIVTGAFNPEGVAGGVLGVMIVGFQRAAFSNEAGLGSAAIAHSAVKTKRPVTEGFVALLEPFIDTVIICTMTALAIVIARPESWLNAREAYAAGESPNPDGVVLTSDAFATVIPWFPIVLAVAVVLFAFSTLITWSYYTLKAWTTLFGRSTVSELVFKVIYCVFIVIGTVLTFSAVLNFADAMLFVCALINIFGLYLLMPEVSRMLREYQADRRSGVVRPIKDRDPVA